MRNEVTKADIDALRREINRNKISRIAGGYIKETGNGMLLTVYPFVSLARIESYTQPTTGVYKWVYTVQPVILNTDGTVTDYGNTISDVLNLDEINNPSDGTGLHGNGIDNSAADWPSGFEIQPAPSDLIVEIKVTANGMYVFNYENGIDGSCS